MQEARHRRFGSRPSCDGVFVCLGRSWLRMTSQVGGGGRPTQRIDAICGAKQRERGDGSPRGFPHALRRGRADVGCVFVFGRAFTPTSLWLRASILCPVDGSSDGVAFVGCPTLIEVPITAIPSAAAAV